MFEWVVINLVSTRAIDIFDIAKMVFHILSPNEKLMAKSPIELATHINVRSINIIPNNYLFKCMLPKWAQKWEQENWENKEKGKKVRESMATHRDTHDNDYKSIVAGNFGCRCHRINNNTSAYKYIFFRLCLKFIRKDKYLYAVFTVSSLYV